MALTTAVRQWSQALLTDIVGITDNVLQFIPSLLVAMLALIFGWITGKILERLLALVLEAVKLDELLARGPVDQGALDSAGVKVSFTHIVGSVMFWATFFFLGIGPAADVVGLTRGRIFIQQIIGFIPEVLGALLILVSALFVATLLKEVIRSTIATSKLSFGREIGWLAYAMIVIFSLGTALKVVGIPTTVITAVIAIVGATIGIALAIGLGIGARAVFAEIITGRELRDRLSKGDEVTIGNYTGTIERLGLDTVELRTTYGLVTVPNSMFIQKAVLKKDSPPRKVA